MVGVQVGQNHPRNVVHAAGGRPGPDQANEGTWAGIHQDRLTIDNYPVGGRGMGRCGYGATGAQDVHSDHGHKATDPPAGVKPSPAFPPEPGPVNLIGNLLRLAAYKAELAKNGPGTGHFRGQFLSWARFYPIWP